jgi:hypothetical protein
MACSEEPLAKRLRREAETSFDQARTLKDDAFKDQQRARDRLVLLQNRLVLLEDQPGVPEATLEKAKDVSTCPKNACARLAHTILSKILSLPAKFGKSLKTAKNQ